MDAPTCTSKTGNKAQFGPFDEKNYNHLRETNCGSSTTGVVSSGRGSNVEGSTEVESYPSPISKELTCVSGDAFYTGIEFRSPQYRSPEYRSPNRGVKKVSVPEITPVCKKASMKDVSPSSDCDVLRLDCSEDDLASICKFSDMEDEELLQIGKNEDESSKKSDDNDDEELQKMRQDLLDSRGKGNFRPNVSEGYLKSTKYQTSVWKISDKEELLRISNEEELLRISDDELLQGCDDLNIASEEELLKSCDEEEKELKGFSDVDFTLEGELLNSCDEEEKELKGFSDVDFTLEGELNSCDEEAEEEELKGFSDVEFTLEGELLNSCDEEEKELKGFSDVDFTLEGELLNTCDEEEKELKGFSDMDFALEEELLNSCDEEEKELKGFSDVDFALEEELLKSCEEEEPQKNSKEGGGNTEDCAFLKTSEEVSGTHVLMDCTVTNINGESAQQVEIIGIGDGFASGLMEDDEKSLLKDLDSKLGVSEAVNGLFVRTPAEEVPEDAEGKLTSSIRDGEDEFSEEELSEDEETVRLTEDGCMVFSKHSDEDDDFLLENDVIQEEDELEILLIKENEEVESKASAEKRNDKSSDCVMGRGVEIPVKLSEVQQSKSAMEKLLVGEEKLAREERHFEASRNADGSVLKLYNHEVQITDKDDLVLAVNVEKNDNILFENGQFGARTGQSSLSAELVEAKNGFLHLRSGGVHSTVRSESPNVHSKMRLAECVDENQTETVCENIQAQEQNECDNGGFQSTEFTEELPVAPREVVVPVLLGCDEDLVVQPEAVSALQNCEENFVSQNCEENSVSPNCEEGSVHKNCEKGTVSRLSEEVRTKFHGSNEVPQNVHEMPISRCSEEVPVAQTFKVPAPERFKEVPVSQLLEEAVGPQRIETVGSQRSEKVLASLGADNTPVSQRAEAVPVARTFKVAAPERSKEVPFSRLLGEAVVSQRIETAGSQRSEVPFSKHIETVGSQRSKKVLVSPGADNTPVSQRAEAVQASRRVDVVQASRRVDVVQASRRVDVVPVSPRVDEVNISQRVNNLFTRRDGQLSESSSTRSAKPRSLLSLPALPNATFTKRDCTYPILYNFADGNQLSLPQGPNLAARWGNQSTFNNQHFTGSRVNRNQFSNVDFTADFNVNAGVDFACYYQDSLPDHWNYIPNGPSGSAMQGQSDTPAASFARGYFDGIQTTPTFFSDETSMDSKHEDFAIKPKSYSDNFKEDEIRDNNDPRWEEIRSLKTDEERYASLRKRWGNLTKPDPRKNLTTHNYLVRNRTRKSQRTESKTPIFTNGRKRRARSSLLGERPGKKLRSILDDKFADVDRKTKEEINRLNDERSLEIDKVEKDKEATISDLVYAYGPNFLNDDYFEQLEYVTSRKKNQIHYKFERSIDDVWKRKAKATEELRSAVNEMEAFYKFYGDESNVHLTPEEVETFVEQERILSMYDKFYSG